MKRNLGKRFHWKIFTRSQIPYFNTFLLLTLTLNLGLSRIISPEKIFSGGGEVYGKKGQLVYLGKHVK